MSLIERQVAASAKENAINKKLVQNGCVAFNDNYINLYRAYAVHANHCSGIESKIQRLKSCGAWLCD